MTQTEQLEVAFPTGEVVTFSDGKTFTVKPLKVGKLVKATKLASSIAGVLLAEHAKKQESFEAVLMALFLKGADDVLELISYGTGFPRAELDELDLDDCARLAVAFFKANEDFFVQRVMPLFTNLGNQKAPSA